MTNPIPRAASFGGAIFSGFANDNVVALRRRSCFGGDGAPACEKLVLEDGYGYCGACSCGRWALARLDGETLPKLRWAKLECPLARPGFSNHVPASSIDV